MFQATGQTSWWSKQKRSEMRTSANTADLNYRKLCKIWTLNCYLTKLMWPFLFYWSWFTRFWILLVLITTCNIFNRCDDCLDLSWANPVSINQRRFSIYNRTMIFILFINFGSWLLDQFTWCLIDCYSLRDCFLNCSFLVLFL